MILTANNIQPVPHEFTPKQLKPYPPDNFIPFEEWFFKNYQPERNLSDRIYLPIQFTAFYCNSKHGRDRKAMGRLQVFLNSLDRSKKYFSPIQYDDGILNNVSDLDLLKFGMGCKGDVQLPLVCQPHKYEFKETGRPIFASFVGAITHPIRQKMVDELQGKEGYFISTELTSLHSYCYILSQSKYVLCFRGYGLSSFRIAESLQYGATPVYITTDDFLFNEGCKNIPHDNVEMMDLFLRKWEHEFRPNKSIFHSHYTYEAVANRIYENL